MISTKKVCVRTANINDVGFIKDCVLGGEKEKFIIPVNNRFPLEELIKNRLYEIPCKFPELNDDYTIVFRYYIAQITGKKVGLLVTATHYRAGIITWHEYHFVYVLPEFRKHRIGAKLLQYVAHEDASRDISSIVVRCLVQNGKKSKSHCYFEKVGFVDIAPGAPVGSVTVLETTPSNLLRCIPEICLECIDEDDTVDA